MSGASISVVSSRGSASVSACGDDVCAIVSSDWRGRIWSDVRLVVYQERSKFGRLLAQVRAKLRRGSF
jgi:hypothetical protein